MDKLILIILFLQATDLYKVLLLPFGLQTNSFSTATLVICLFYISFNIKNIKKILKFKTVFNFWLWMVWFFPVLFTILHLYLDNLNELDLLYWVSFISLFGSMFLCATIVAFKNQRDKNFDIFFLLIFISSAVGIVLSYTNFGFIALLLSTSSANSTFAEDYSVAIDRALGFYGQQNLSAKSFVLSFLYLYVISLKNKNQILKYLLIVVGLICIYFTGSRTSMVIFFLQLAILIPLFTISSKLKLFVVARYFALGGLFILVLIWFASFSVSLGLPDLTERLNFEDTNLSQDGSVNARIGSFNAYVDKVEENLLVGKGPVYREEMLKTNVFPVASQNEYLETAVAFGVVSVLYYILLLLYTVNKTLKDKNDYAKTLGVLLLVFAIYGFSVNYLFIDRMNVILLGILFGLLIKLRNFKKQEIRKTNYLP
ncbi:O-antigen ligase [Flavobacterium antarcticum]|uniref:O-antigen ligase family protein n=1 Tax=Flavobacterium antarcticum TaxID=271155 RepID=UPI000428CB57|nr:O-antigen ligase family protein [Flavobacterium antarcticum]